MRRLLLFLFLSLFLAPCFAQKITLRQLMSFHSLDDSSIYRLLKRDGWRYYGVQYNTSRKPKMYAYNGAHLAGPLIPDAQLLLYNYQKKPLAKVEFITSNVRRFNATIRDSLSAYGFLPDIDARVPDEDNLKISSSATFINRDAMEPIHALILYYKEKNTPRVSLTIFGD